MAQYLKMTDEKQGIDTYIPTKETFEKSLAGKQSIQLLASGWNNKQQTIQVQGVIADESKQLVVPIPAVASQTAFYNSIITCIGFAENSLTFSCKEVPSTDINLFILLYDILK